jgi:type I restriction enzyme S subunit
MREWRRCTIGGLIEEGVILVHKDGNHGANYPRLEDFGNEGFPFLTAKSLSDGRIDIEGAPRLSGAKAKTLRFGFVKEGDVLLSHNATVGRVAIVPKNEHTLVIGTSLTQFRPKPDVLMPEFLALYFMGRDFQNYLSFVMAQTTRNQVPITEQRRLPLHIPPIQEQRAIVGVVFSLINKIELNRRMNETLEAMARAIFQDWFVTFGPTRAKMEGRPPYLAPDLWSLFPDRLDTEGKPEGWREVPLDQIADFLNGLALQKYPGTDDDDLPVIKIAELRAGVATGNDRASRSIPLQYVVEDGDVLFSWSGSLLQRIWTGGRGALNQHLFKVTSKQWPKWLHYLWVDHHLPNFQAIAASKATTMGHIQRHHLSEAMTVIGSPDVMAAGDALIGPLLDRCLVNSLEARTLAATRDLLLPRLMSGELRVKDAERVVETAA